MRQPKRHFITSPLLLRGIIMIGIFGSSLASKDQMRIYKRYFPEREHSDMQWEGEACWLGGGYHTRGNLFRTDEFVAVSDSDAQVLEFLDGIGTIDDIITYKSGIIAVNQNISGSLGLYDKINHKLVVYSDWANSYPIYYTSKDGVLSFSSHLRPLANILGSELDWVGATEYMLWGYCIGGRTPFQHIRRLMPGQYVLYDVETGKISLGDTSRLWTTANDLSRADMTDIWRMLSDDCRHHARNEKLALMLSGGWDSRLILGPLSQNVLPAQVGTASYAFGGVNSIEMVLSGRLAEKCHLRHHRIEVPQTVYGVDYLQRVFARAENILLPAWYYCAHGAGVSRSDIRNAWRNTGRALWRRRLGGRPQPGQILDILPVVQK
jgi:hypothetical protein